MTPWHRAAQWHARYFPNENFGQTIADNIARDNGLVVAHRGLFLLAQEVCYDERLREIVVGEPNAWHVQLAAVPHDGAAIYECMAAAPYPHQWCLWQRRADGRLRAHRWDDLLTKQHRKD